ncbi:GGDEF domain-containing protein [Sulfurimonas sp.]|nr:GGDEF domain-containing protein [Sulfurimonas sp.]
MRTKSRLLLIVTLMLLGLTTATIINVSLNFREYSINSAIEKSEMAASIVKDGLTSHMVNGIMDKREHFIEQISRNNDIDSLWLVRSQSVIKQYGKGFNHETVRDAIDSEVIKTGKTVRKITENSDKTSLRVTIPYKADTTVGNPNCMSCHDVAKGETLGAVSMEFDISSMRNSGMFTILKILGINILFIVVVLILINYYVSPYMKLFTNLQDGVARAYKGDFTHRFESKVGGDARKVIEQMNSFMEKMQGTFGDIKYNLATFIPQGCVSTIDPLSEAKTIINELSDIYKFKKTIELDASKDEVYKRLIDIFKLRYTVGNFSFFEVNNISQERTLIYTTNEDGTTICSDESIENAKECRVFRTNSVAISTEFPNLCHSCVDSNMHYVCIPFNINNEVSLNVSLSSMNKDDVEMMKQQTPSIKHYLEAAKPVIESQILMERLRETSLKDGMTGLYNRRFLEEIIDKIMSQAARTKDTYSILMLDVDFFKKVNDTYGHDVGDMVIMEIGKVLKENIREADLAIRYGGEEFVVLLQNATLEGTNVVAQKIHAAFAERVFNVGSGETMQKTMSIGVAMFPTDGDTIWQTIKLADTALYSAKTTGRNKIVHYDPSMEGEDVR